MANNDSSVQIIPFYAHPHVHTVINDNTQYDETVATPIDDSLPFSTCIVSGADTGIDNVFVRLTDLATKQKIFGKSNFAKYGQPSIQADVLFNGSTNIWFCRVLPDNATYANVVVLAHYRKGAILDELGQETGKSRLEIKFSVAYANKPYVVEGAKSASDIEAFAQSLASDTADPQTGYMTLPLFFVRSIGRGKYGNNYSISISRDTDFEKEYETKNYLFSLISNSPVTQIINKFSGSFTSSSKYDVSTIITDVLDQYATGSCPIDIQLIDGAFDTLFDFYKDEIVAPNLNYITASGSTDPDELADINFASNMLEEEFDPIFGRRMNTRTDEEIPYYRNYTATTENTWTPVNLEIPNTEGATRPLNISDWATAFVGARVLVVADALNDGKRWIYTVTGIDIESGNITYDEGVQSEIDADQYDGVNLSEDIGLRLSGGHDGDFQEVSKGGESRTPTNAEMKLLLSREYVKVFRGYKDRNILSPARIDLDYIFDANYNMTTDDTLDIDSSVTSLYNNSSVLTDKDAQVLSTLQTSGYVLDLTDLNVKQAIYDLNEFRNRNGMTIDKNRGAGCHVYFDCGLVGTTSTNINYVLSDVLSMMEPLDGRGCSCDLGYYDIYDPVSRRRITVTVTYYIAKYLIPHIIKFGINKPFVFSYAKMSAIQPTVNLITSGDFIRDSFGPNIDLIDWDIKEQLHGSRINYYLTSDEGRVVQRACQNTRQTEASALLEENNVRVLNTLKKGLDAACRDYLYEWNDPTVRKSYTDAQMQKYRPWIGDMVQDLDISFEANEFEQERMMMHCYTSVAFRDIAKRIILEININRPQYSAE